MVSITIASCARPSSSSLLPPFQYASSSAHSSSCSPVVRGSAVRGRSRRDLFTCFRSWDGGARRRRWHRAHTVGVHSRCAQRAAGRPGPFWGRGDGRPPTRQTRRFFDATILYNASHRLPGCTASPLYYTYMNPTHRLAQLSQCQQLLPRTFVLFQHRPRCGPTRSPLDPARRPRRCLKR
jgi:hypothetical protein